MNEPVLFPLPPGEGRGEGVFPNKLRDSLKKPYLNGLRSALKIR